MRHPTISLAACVAAALCVTSAAMAGAHDPAAGLPAIDPRLREVLYDPHAVVTVPVKRGVVTLVQLDADEVITEVAAGLGSDCTKPEASWCIAAQAGDRTLFVKPKRLASAPNNLAVVTNRRTHAFRFIVLSDSDSKQPVFRLVVKAPAQAASRSRISDNLSTAEPIAPALGSLSIEPSPQAVVADRLQSKPQVRNTRYSLAVGTASTEIVPTLVFDDGRFTYLRFPGNREVPAVFHVLEDGTETIVNARMEDDLLVVDRVSRHLMLRAGSAVVGVWNDAFDLDGVPPQNGTTATGVERLIKTAPSAPSIALREVRHD